ncbi:MAG TPA: histidine kinase, partial [Candidatus Nanopelagicales bacterium]|nr:histidine kinase [Candidatus Nanopelagicales bacterium]
KCGARCTRSARGWMASSARNGSASSTPANANEKPCPPDLPIVVGLDGGYVHSAALTSRRNGSFEVIAGKVIPAEGAPSCLAHVQTCDTKAKRRLFEALQSQGMTASQQVTFLTDGGEDIRDLPYHLNAQAEHLLDWFHITMRITVMVNSRPRRADDVGLLLSERVRGRVPCSYAARVVGLPRGRPAGLTPRSLAVDVLLSGVAVYAASLLTAEIRHVLTTPPSAVLAHTVAAVHGGSVAARRLWPGVAVTVLLVTAGIYALGLELPVYMLGPAALLVAYGVGAACSLRRGMALVGAILVALVVLLRWGNGFPGWDSVALFAGLTAAAWYLGVFARRWQTLARENARRAAELEQARTELASHAVAAERLRIARELHDVIAHSMSVVAMHAGAARLAVGCDEAAERTALDVIERSSRSALEEMRRLVTVLRDEHADGATRSPVPAIGDLHALVAGVAAAGVTVEVQTDGDLAAVPAGVSLAGYRVVQEALTNIVRHAGPTSAHLLVRADGDELVIRVDNDAPALPPVPAQPAGGRHGASGMRERVQLYGGTLDAGPVDEGGWGVLARLPYGVVR